MEISRSPVDGIIRPKPSAINQLRNQKNGLNQNQMKVLQEQVLLDSLSKHTGQDKCFDISLSGTSATIVIQLPKKIIVGWVGDSQVSIQNREKSIKDIPLTTNHTPDVEKEKIRIFNSRGETRQSNLDKKSKIYVRARMYPGLSISRSLGDLLAHHIGVTSEPQVAVREIESGDKFMTIATDGVWSHLAPEEVGEIVGEFGLKDAQTTCDLITQKINDICRQDNQDTEDITFIISHIGNPLK